ncbi:MAG: site-specific integrase [Pseudomonadota bacterium]|nr:site-specific integrase [Pseudomonadota bacterium]
MKAHITKRTVDALKVPEGADRAKLYDDTLTGFGVTAWASGKRVFFIEYGGRGQQRRMTLGEYGPLTVDAARTMAQIKLGEFVQGVDPLAAREERAGMPTFSKWRDDYLEGVRRRKKQPRHDEHYLAAEHADRKHARKRKPDEAPHPIATVAARWARKPLDQISRADVETGMLAVAERGHTSANRWLAAVRACFEHAVETKVIRENPAMGIKPYREAPPRARVLTDDEFGRVVAAFDALPDPFVRAAFVLLMDTGARKSEVLGARWDDFDLDGGLWRIPSPKAGRPQTIPLSESTVAYLGTVDRIGPWFSPGRDATKHRGDLRRAWDTVREEAALVGVTIHDLRRTFGLHVAKRAGLHIASKLLRHSDIRVTERVYAPLGMDDLRTAVTGMQGARLKLIEAK